MVIDEVQWNEQSSDFLQRILACVFMTMSRLPDYYFLEV